MRLGRVSIKSLAVAAGLFMFSKGAVFAADPAPRYVQPDASYGHGAVANGEWAFLELANGARIAPPAGAVFEGIAPLIAPDGTLYAVESSQSEGSRIVKMSPQGALIAAGDWIGTRHRWLSLAGWGVEQGQTYVIAVDRPHLRGDLLSVRQDGDRLISQVIYQGVTNHQYRSATLWGGMRDCPQGGNFVFATMDWQTAVRLEVTAFSARAVGQVAGAGPRALSAAMACD
ncbi:hypothetical protein [Albirhodobacter sp. R86504]|uniref:hypothetical protein n=1 Tax=Albirhodobacter sp. R86504 TaxID=3093848 RepID=UPI00366AA158